VNIDTIEHQIEATRHELDQTLTALGERLSPSRRARAAWGVAQQRGAAAARTGVSWANAHPLWVLGIAAAVVCSACLRRPVRRAK
jgi:hypothetical protein